MIKGRLLTPWSNTGGRFPSDFGVPRARGESTGQSSGSSDPDPNVIAAAGAIPGSNQIEREYAPDGKDPYRLDGVSAGTRPGTATTDYTGSNFEEMPRPDQQRTEAVSQQQRTFLAREPADPSDPSAEHSSLYGDWMAPAATGVAGAGVGAAAVGAYGRGQDDQDALHTDAVTADAERQINPPPTDNVLAFETNKNASESRAGNGDFGNKDMPPPAMTSTLGNESLGGLESEGAHETGAVFPAVVRHDTEMSVSQLHVPGDYPNQT